MIEVPSSPKTGTLADWAEASCLFGNTVFISEYELERALDHAGMSDPDEAVSNIRQEIALRHCLAYSAHPVRIIRDGLERTKVWDHNLVYAFQLLLACLSQYRSTQVASRDWLATGKLFERVSTLALEHYLGGKAINIGSPRDGQVPARFGDCLDYLCKNLQEMRGARRLYTSTTKDDGVDVVAWRAFGDQRPGQVIILAQCAAGASRRGKTIDIKLDLWEEHIDWLTKPLKAFAFPYVCLNDMQWRRLSRQIGGLVFDRLRITSMFVIADKSSTTAQTIQMELSNWCHKHLSRLPWLDR